MSFIADLTPNRSDLVKDRLRIVIFGAYRPSEAKSRLVAFKEFLQSNGYPGTRLVDDFSIPTQNAGENLSVYLWQKCQYWLQTADVVIFVFFKEGKLEGMTREFSHFVDNLKGRLWRGIVFTEPPMSHMILGPLEIFRNELKQDTFSGDADLYELSLGYLLDYPKKLFFDIKDRTPFSTND